MRFDRILTNPSFSQNYSQEELKFRERFPFGFCPEGGKKADLMFVQHMLSVLKPGGMAVTVMPHGVLFRGGVEKDIRTELLNRDLLETVIGLAPNLFYGTGIPACILVLRAKGAKPPERQGKVLFINADREYYEGRAQNYLQPEHLEKIVSAWESFENVPGFAQVVSREELREHGDNLNIRRYADNALPPEPHDVRAHLHGGVPKAEVKEKQKLFEAHGLDPRRQDVAVKLSGGRFRMRRKDAAAGREHLVRWYTAHARPWLEARVERQAGRLEKCVGALCCAGILGCTGPSQNVRPLPPPRNCPAGAQEAMEKYDLSKVAVLPPDGGWVEGASVRLELQHGQLAFAWAEGRVFFRTGPPSNKCTDGSCPGFA